MPVCFVSCWLSGEFKKKKKRAVAALLHVKCASLPNLAHQGDKKKGRDKKKSNLWE